MPIRNLLLAAFAVILPVLLVHASSSGASPAIQGPAAAPPVRVAVADFQAIEKASGGEVEAFQERRLEPVRAKAEELRTLQLRILKEKAVMDPAVSTELQQQAQQLKQDIAQEEQAAFSDVQRRRASQRSEIQAHLARIAAARGVQLVLNRGDAAVLWADSAIDLTAEVITSMTARAR